jgi:hypothetical protein
LQGQPVEYAALSLPSWEDARARCAEAIESIWRRLAFHAWVDTALGDRIVARTVVTYQGDTYSTWADGSPARLVERHSNAVLKAIEERHQLLRLITVAMRVLSIILAASANPALSVPALLSAWHLAGALRDAMDVLISPRT